MRYKFFFCWTFCFILLGAQSSDVLIDRAIQLYETRHFSKDNLNKSYEILSRLLQEEPDNLRACYEMARVCQLLGDIQDNKKDRLNFYNKGIEYGKKALSLDKNSAEAHFWYMVNLGRTAQTKGALNSLKLVSEIKKEIETVLEIEPKHTGALDAYAMFYYELPKLMGGDLNKSIEYLNRAIAIDSNLTLLYVDMARVYIKKKEFERARWFLNRVLQITNPTSEADYILNDKPRAVELLKEIEEK
ncbi:MAG: TRAP transporter TatT component family protein [candidate division WOR-3 bacterium]